MREESQKQEIGTTFDNDIFRCSLEGAVVSRTSERACCLMHAITSACDF